MYTVTNLPFVPAGPSKAPVKPICQLNVAPWYRPSDLLHQGLQLWAEQVGVTVATQEIVDPAAQALALQLPGSTTWYRTKRAPFKAVTKPMLLADLASAAGISTQIEQPELKLRQAVSEHLKRTQFDIHALQGLAAYAVLSDETHALAAAWQNLSADTRVALACTAAAAGAPTALAWMLTIQPALATCVDTAETRSTPLHYACLSGHPQCTKILLDHGADAAAVSSVLKQPTFLAARNGCCTTLKLLALHTELVDDFNHQENIFHNLVKHSSSANQISYLNAYEMLTTSCKNHSSQNIMERLNRATEQGFTVLDMAEENGQTLLANAIRRDGGSSSVPSLAIFRRENRFILGRPRQSNQTKLPKQS